MGSPGIATAPRMMMTIAITIAKTGRSMKNFAMWSGPLLFRGGGRFLVRRGIDDRPRPHREQAFDDHAVAGLETLFYEPRVANTGAGLHGTHLNLVIRANGVDALQALVLLHGTLRDEDDAGAMVGDEADASELAGEQRVLWVRELGLNFEGASLGVDLVERVGHAAGVGELGIVGEDELELRTVGCDAAFARRELEILSLAHFEADPDRVQRDDGGEGLCGI